ncbi:MAG: IS66 family transposase [Fimbriimonadales bacterium]
MRRLSTTRNALKHVLGGPTVMRHQVSSEFVEAFSLCPRKAFLLMTEATASPGPHDYEAVIWEQAEANRQAHRARLADVVPFGGPAEMAAGREIVADADLTSDGLHARCDFLTKVNESSRLGRFGYEPVKVIGACRASRPDVLGLAYQGLVLGEVQGRQPSSGTLILLGDRPCKVKLAGKYKEVRRIVEALRAWASQPVDEAPSVVLNKHCPSCAFRDACLQQAEKEDNLTLLDRMTPKLMQKYHDKGIFTVRQLSHIYKPRRSRKKAKRQVRHSLELQALAMRTGKVHVEHLPELPRSLVALFLDIEGVPDRDFHYLAGILVYRGGDADYESFWADDATGEAAMWSALVKRLAAFPDSPVYHYGSYEKKAFATLAKRYGIGGGFCDRLVNVATSVYGKVYFPVRSNGLKSLGRFLGAAWTDPQASGLQSLVWRHRWEMTRGEQFRQSLLRYNREDCEAVRLLVGRLDQVRRDAASDPTIEFASRPKRHATETGKAVHGQFERILKSAQAAFVGRGIHIREAGRDAADAATTQEPRQGHPHFRRIVPRASRTVLVEPKRRCPKHDVALVPKPEQPVEKTVIDLVFTKSGCRKTVTKYLGIKSRCPKDGQSYNPDSIRGPQSHAFGHELQAWAIYQRVVLRLPYEIIAQVMDHLFGIGLGTSTLVYFVGNLAGYYAPTEAAILRAILKSDFVHVDETKINIQGVDHYVWVFTDGKHVIFRMTETREADIVREVLSGYQGVLVSDFYPGYDSMPCRQQKCLVHLIRDINDDLWKAPFDKELEAFAVRVQALLVPMLAEVDRYGLKAWHLRKFLKDVERFYDKHIIGREYTSEPVRIFQKRFDRYRECLFTFLTQDGIPWENNMAERAIRQLAVQRKISGSFFKRVAPQYLLLLAISQTCRFQGKSFLKFLLSKETDLDSFRRTRPIRYSYAVGERKCQPSAPPYNGGEPSNDATN